MGHLKERVNHFVRVDANEALRIADIAWRLSSRSENPLARVLGIRTKAQALWAKGEYQAALDLFEEAERIYADLGMALEVAQVARSKVTVLMYLGRYAEALETAERARQVFAAHHETVLLAQLDMNVGNIYHRLDQHSKALEFYERALAVFTEMND